MSAPVKVEFLGLIPTLFAHCSHCMDIMHMCNLEPYYEQMKEYPKEVVETYYNFTKLALDLKKEFGEKVFVDVIDVASIQGIWKTVKHRVLKTPCVLVDGEKVSEPEASLEELRGRIAQKIG